jgi:acyl-CoA thioester hydrolase
MPDFRFFHPIEVRYADIDAQRHVNNVAYFAYMETARAHYMQHLGLWDGRDFLKIGIILAETSCSYKTPISYGQPLRVGVRTVRLGTKSLELNYTLQDAESGEELATGRSIQVAYDYPSGKSIPIPDAWRAYLTAFDGLTPEQGGAAG